MGMVIDHNPILNYGVFLLYTRYYTLLVPLLLLLILGYITLPHLELSVPFVHFLLTVRVRTIRSPTGAPSIAKPHTINVCWKVVWQWPDR